MSSAGFAPKVASDPKAPFLNLKSSRCKMCLHSWGRLLAIFPPHHLRVGGPLGHLTRPVLSYKEEGAFCGPLRIRTHEVVLQFQTLEGEATYFLFSMTVVL